MTRPVIGVAWQVRDEAARLVAAHASRLGMDSLAADLLLNIIRKLPVAEPDPDSTEWVWVGGARPTLPCGTFVIARYEGENRKEAEAFRDGYGEPEDQIRWSGVVEYRRKAAAGAAS